jgi:hypothetical protein
MELPLQRVLLRTHPSGGSTRCSLLCPRNTSLGIAAPNEKALAVMRWQPVQWQAMVNKGGALIRSRTWRQQQPPSTGNPVPPIENSFFLGQRLEPEGGSVSTH